MTVIRPVAGRDLAEVLAINNAAVPAVNQLELEDLEWFIEVSTWFSVVEAGNGLAGFLLGLGGPGLEYASDNWKWFSERYPQGFGYVDRIVVDPGASGAGIGQALYTTFAAHVRSTGLPRVCCEVNIKPHNERSLVFHEAFGFEAVGEQNTEGGAKRVRLFTLEL